MDNKYLLYFVCMTSSWILSSRVCNRFNLNQKLWSKINRRINPSSNGYIWFFTALLVQIGIFVFLDAISISDVGIRIILGFTMGFSMYLIPQLKKSDENR